MSPGHVLCLPQSSKTIREQSRPAPAFERGPPPPPVGPRIRETVARIGNATPAIRRCFPSMSHAKDTIFALGKKPSGSQSPQQVCPYAFVEKRPTKPTREPPKGPAATTGSAKGSDAPTPRITNLAALTLAAAPATIRPTSELRREAPVRTAIHSTLCGREQGPRPREAVPPKEQPPWNLSGTRDRKGDDSLESGHGTPHARQCPTDGVGGAGNAPRNLSGPHDRQGHDGNGAAR